MSGLLHSCDYFSIDSACFLRSAVVCFYSEDSLNTTVLLSNGVEIIVDVSFTTFRSLFFS